MKGFTLIEILVVLFIVSLLTGLVVANLPAFVSQADFEEEAERLKFVFEYGHETAQVDAVEIGVELAPDSYGFVIFDESRQTWISSDAPELKTPRVTPRSNFRAHHRRRAFTIGRASR